MSKYINKIKEYINSLTSTQRLWTMIIIVAILMCFYFIFINNNYRGADINYKATTAESIIEKSTLVYDRDELLMLDGIIDNILKIKNNTWYVKNNFVKIKDLYSSAVTTTYKRKLSKGKFSSNLELLYSNVLGDSGVYDNNKNYMEKVYYDAEDNMYLIKFITINGEDNYLGVRINNSNFMITYLK